VLLVPVRSSTGSGAGGFIGSSVGAIDVKGDIGTGLFSGTNVVKGNRVFGADCSPLFPGRLLEPLVVLATVVAQALLTLSV
jgi:hypothetical protein